MDAAIALTGVKVLDDDNADFADFYSTSWPRLFRVIYAISGDVGSAEDALQSAYAKALLRWRRVRSADHPEAYVRRMAVNELLGVRRRAWWRAEQSHAEPPPSTPATSHEAAVVDRAAVWRAVLALPVRQRAVIVLRYYEDLSESEIAAILECSRGTVKSQASDALASLRARGAELVADPPATGDLA